VFSSSKLSSFFSRTFSATEAQSKEYGINDPVGVLREEQIEFKGPYPLLFSFPDFIAIKSNPQYRLNRNRL
jgi:hypothetical protein